jgi:DNA-binding LytR/AlgR family response regulator
MESAGHNRKDLARLGLIFAAWTFYGLLFASQNYLQAIYRGLEADWQSALSVWLTCAYSWAALTPLIITVARRFRYPRVHLPWAVLVHVPLAVLASLIILAVYTGVRFLIFREAVDFPKLVVGEFRVTMIVYFVVIGITYAVDRFSPRAMTAAASETVRDTPADTVPPPEAPHLETPVMVPAAKPAFADRLSVRQNGSIVLIKVDEIDLVTSDGNYVRLHINGRSHLLRDTMKAMEQKLDPAEFLRVRRSAMVRISAIKEIHPLFNGEFEIRLVSGKKVASSRRYKRNLDPVLKD